MKPAIQKRPLAAVDAAVVWPPWALSASSIASAACALAGAWIAAGSVGLLAHPLQHALAWLAALAAVVTGWRSHDNWPRRLRAAAALAIAAVMLACTNPIANILAMALITAALATSPSGNRRPFLLVSTAIALLAVYRIAYAGIPLVFSAADAAGELLGRIAEVFAGKPLWVGATFGGLDFLLVMAVIYGGILLTTPPPRLNRAIYGAIGIIVAHGFYLFAIALLPAFLGPPPPPAPPSQIPGFVPPATWDSIIRPLVPWNLPAFAAILHLLVAIALLKVSRWPQSPATNAHGAPIRMSWAPGQIAAAAVLATALPIATSLWLEKPTLQGKKIVLFEKGFLNWLRPEHGQYGRLSVGMYGMMPQYLQSLGAQCLISRNLSDADLTNAHVLVLIYPNKPWEPGQLDRIQKFVRDGGCLLVLGEHTIHEGKAPVIGDKPDNRFNDVLASTSMYVPFDSAMFQIGGWLQSYESISHPALAGIREDRNQYGVVTGASVKIRWPAKPLIVGRWGWNDPGDVGSASAMMGNHHYDGGERLGDVILAAEQPLGKGKVVAFGDTSGFINGITYGSHLFTSRLFAHLADGRHDVRPLWRQLVALLAAVALAVLLLRGRSEWTIAAAAIALAPAVIACTRITQLRGEVLPDGERAAAPVSLPETEDSFSPRRDLARLPVLRNALAYVASSNLEASSEESLRPDGTGGFVMTLMRNGYLTLSLPEISRDRLSRAAMLVSVAPQRPVTAAERRIIREFVENGGTFIITAGYDCHEAGQEILADFGLWVGHDPTLSPAEPEPMGHFKSPYIPYADSSKDLAHVRFHAAWPVGCKGIDLAPTRDLTSLRNSVRVIAYGRTDKPVVLVRPVKKGKVVLVGDTSFVMNMNLEHEDGRPFEGMRENADFWRWFITYLLNPDDQKSWWIPTKPKLPANSPATDADQGGAP